MSYDTIKALYEFYRKINNFEIDDHIFTIFRDAYISLFPINVKI